MSGSLKIHSVAVPLPVLPIFSEDSIKVRSEFLRCIYRKFNFSTYINLFNYECKTVVLEIAQLEAIRSVAFVPDNISVFKFPRSELPAVTKKQ